MDGHLAQRAKWWAAVSRSILRTASAHLRLALGGALVKVLVVTMISGLAQPEGAVAREDIEVLVLPPTALARYSCERSSADAVLWTSEFGMMASRLRAAS
jgi:hypothetical protein